MGGKKDMSFRSWMRGDAKRGAAADSFHSIASALPKLYKERMLPVEKAYFFHQIYSSEMSAADFVAKPMVLLFGQYSAGKSTFVKHLLGRDYPGLRIGPEPTTDKFVAVTYGDQDAVIPGNAACVDASMPYTQLSSLGNNFLTRFEVAKMSSDCLKGLTLIDSPGVLSGEKQRVNRGYDFEHVVKWFCDRVDMVIVIFDVAKLDISDELKKTLLATKGNDSKVHVLLNKADRCTTSQLMRVYGALMWNLGKVLNTPEVCRVYIGSFWDEPLNNTENMQLFEREERDLYQHLASLPRGASVRKMNDLIKRARQLKTHAYLMGYLKKQLPMVGKSKAWARAIEPEALKQAYFHCTQLYGCNEGDFPDPTVLSQKLVHMQLGENIRTMQDLDKNFQKKFMDPLNTLLSVDLPKLIQIIPAEMQEAEDATILNLGGREDGGEDSTPFGANAESRKKLDVAPFLKEFVALKPSSDTARVGEDKIVPVMMKSGLKNDALDKVWKLALRAKVDGVETDKKSMDLWQYSVIKKLIADKVSGQGMASLPDKLPDNMKPDSYDIQRCKKAVLDRLQQA